MYETKINKKYAKRATKTEGIAKLKISDGIYQHVE